jgi:hypothetical protein
VAERVESEERDGLVVIWLLDPLSLPLPVCLLLPMLLGLRSSVILDELTSLRSSSEVLVALLDEMKL